jgi:hypothetical protein
VPALVGLALGVVLLLSMSQMPASNAVRTSLLQLVDSKGTVRASLGFIDADQTPALSMMDPNGVRRLQVGLEFDGSPLIQFSDENSRIGIDMSLDSPVVMAAGGSRTGDARIAIGKDGNIGLLRLTTETVEGKTVGRISLMDSSNQELFSQPKRR